MDKIRVLQVIGGGEVGGAEELVLTLMKLLNPERYESHLICLCQGPFVDLGTQYGFKSSLIPMRNRLDITTVKPLRRYIRDNNIDVVHTHGVRANLVARMAARREGVPVVTTVHSILDYDYDSSLKSSFARLITSLTNRNTEHFIAISDAIAEDIRSMGVSADKITVIHNGVDVTRFSATLNTAAMRKELKLEEDRKTITMVARLHPVKGHEFFLAAARRIIDAGCPAQFLIIGEGNQRAVIEEQVRQLGLEAVVRMPGYFSHVEDIYGVSDILCVPSIMEGLGLVVLEAFYFGVPVVASRIGGIPEIIKDGENGLLVEPRDEKGLAEAVIKLLKDPELADKFRQRGRETFNNFSQDTMAPRVEVIYEQVLR